MKTPDEIDEIYQAFRDVLEMAPEATVSSICSSVGYHRMNITALNKTRAKRGEFQIKSSGDRSLASYYQEYCEGGMVFSCKALAERVNRLRTLIESLA